MSGRKGAAGPRLQPGDAGQRVLHLVHRLAGAAGDFRDAPLAERLHEIADDAVFQGVLLAGAFELEHQAFAQIARADAGRIKGLNDFQHLGDFFRRQIGGGGQFLDGRLEIAVIVNVADDQFGDGRCSSVKSDSRTCSISICAREVPAVSESNMNCRFSSSSVDVADRGVGLGKMVAPFLVQLHQLLELRLEIVHRRSDSRLFQNRCRHRHILGAFGGIERGGGVAGFAHVLDRFVRQFHFRARRFLPARDFAGVPARPEL